MSKLNPSLECCVLLAKTLAKMSRQFDGRLGCLHGLSFSDLVVMLELNRAPSGRLRRVDLAEQLGVTASAVTRTLIPLEKIGLLTREPDPRDARVGYAALTKTGERLLQEALASAESIATEVIDSKTASALQKLLA